MKITNPCNELKIANKYFMITEAEPYANRPNIQVSPSRGRIVTKALALARTLSALLLFLICSVFNISRNTNSRTTKFTCWKTVIRLVTGNIKLTPCCIGQAITRLKAEVSYSYKDRTFEINRPYFVIWHIFSKSRNNNVQVGIFYLTHLVLHARSSLTITRAARGPDHLQTSQNARSL